LTASAPPPAARGADPQAVRVIVHADDLGMSQRVNDQTFALMEAGRVTSATILAGGPALDDALRRLPDFPRCSFGAHLALTEFGPLTGDPRLAFLCGPDGTFANRRAALADYRRLLDRGVQDALFGELSAQVQRLLDAGVPLTHLDSHHHSHTIGALFPVLKRVQRAFGIRRIRIRMNRFDGVFHHPEGPLRAAKTALLNAALRHVYESATPDAFTALRAFVHPRAHQGIRPGHVVELMVHPGHPLCEPETALIATPWERDLPFPVTFISYLDLPLP